MTLSGVSQAADLGSSLQNRTEALSEPIRPALAHGDVVTGVRVYNTLPSLSHRVLAFPIKSYGADPFYLWERRIRISFDLAVSLDRDIPDMTAASNLLGNPDSPVPEPDPDPPSLDVP